MRTQGVEKVSKKGQNDEYYAPPFNSRNVFTLKRLQATEDIVVDESPLDLEISSVLNPLIEDDIASVKRHLELEHRPWIIYEQLQSGRHSDSKLSNMCLSPDVHLPKGVVRGCSDCSDCQKVLARWDPEAACFYELEPAPVFHPSYEEFKDTSKYIDSIRQQVEPFGICRIVPPPSWKPPCIFEEDDIWQSYKFRPQVQRVNGLHDHHSPRNVSADGDLRDVKRRKLEYESSDGSAANFSSVECHGPEGLQNECCPQFSLIGFKRYADYFKQCYFSRISEIANGGSPSAPLEQREPSEPSIEGEYWRIVEKPTYEIDVLCSSGSFSSVSTPTLNKQQRSDSLENSTSVWDLNSISSLPGSLLSFEDQDLSSNLKPQLHIGMCFSSVPWTLEEHRFYRLQYLHLGAPRIWYSIPESDTVEFEAIKQKLFPNSSEENRKLIQSLEHQPSLGKLKSEGVPVYRCVQRPGDLLLFLPGAYYSGFDCGFNCSASAVFAPLYWLPRGLSCTELYREQKRKTSISYDKLLFSAANEVVKARWKYLIKGEKTPVIMMWKEASGKDGVVTKALEARVRSEARCRQYFAAASQSKKMDKSFDYNDQKRECCTCFYDLYLSAATCPCNQNRYSCLAHAKHLCSCPWSDKIFVYRYQISELNILTEAVVGKIAPMRDWIREDLGKLLQLDEQDQCQKGATADPSSVTQASEDRAPSPEKTQASCSRMVSKEKDPVLEELLTDDLKEKAMEYILKGSDDDSSLSSCSDWDIDAYIARLESRKL